MGSSISYEDWKVLSLKVWYPLRVGVVEEVVLHLGRSSIFPLAVVIFSINTITVGYYMYGKGSVYIINGYGF